THSPARRRIYVGIDPSKDVGAGSSTQPASFPTNKVQTSKYTVITFIPKNLFEQFRSVANFYFLSLVILQLFEPFKNVDPSLTATPLLIIVGVTSIKNAFEDMKRHSSDKRVNSKPVYILSNWKNVNNTPHTPEQRTLFHQIRAFCRNAIKLIEHSVYLLASTPVRIIRKGWVYVQSMRGKSGTGTAALAGADKVLYPAELLPEHYLGNGPNSPTTTTKSASDAIWKLGSWQNVKVGDIILLRGNDDIPADVLVLSTSEKDCICYVETKNLDGETNLKIRRGAADLTTLTTPQQCGQLCCYVDLEPPNPNLYTFNAVLSLNPPLQKTGMTPSSSSPKSKTIIKKDNLNTQLSSPSLSPTFSLIRKDVPIGINALLMRGCIIRNTKWVIGLVVYTGSETKIILNSGATPSKRSRIERQMNPQASLPFNETPWTFDFNQNSGVTDSPAFNSFVTFFQCMIIFQNIIPIAVFLSVDVAKTFQSLMIYLDDDMYNELTESSASPQSWNLCDDLGQIEYIFSDKTGTLTSNIMEFRKCTIGGVVYGKDITAKRGQGLLDEESEMRKLMFQIFNPVFIDKSNLPFVDSKLFKDFLIGDSIQTHLIKDFFTLLAVCHTVLIEFDGDDREKMNFLRYNAQSPDEAALVTAAKNLGFAFLGREDSDIFIDIFGIHHQFCVLHVLEFNSDRKRMSTIVRDTKGQIILFCKGADSVIYERLESVHHKSAELTVQHLEEFANEGLRTLCLAYRVIPDHIYISWAEKYRQAQLSIINRESCIEDVANEIERNLILLGGTAIEDRLQDGVPETIALLSKAGIKIWVLTGDKMETAINIGFACNLLSKSMILIVIHSSTMDMTLQQLQEALDRFWDDDGHPRTDGVPVPDSSSGVCSHALIIDGESLKFALDNSGRAHLLELACRCKAVVCCRVSPLQKAKVVSMVRTGLGAMCLAIGDGANDVSMIQEADIGIGISGKEGMQAVMASDYAIGQFRFLGKLLLVHGKWAYLRISEMILNYFYKNIVWLFVLFWYQFDCAFTADLITEFSYGMFFQTLFSLLPNLVIGTLDQDVNDKISLMIPELYQKGIQQTLYNMERFWLYILDGIYQSTIAYYFPLLAFSDGSIDSLGRSSDKSAIGTVIAFVVVISVNIYMTINTMQWTWVTICSLLLTIAVFATYVCIFATSTENSTFGQLDILPKQVIVYAIVALAVFTSIFPRVLIKFLQQYYYPSDTDIIQEV
ncbi:hypothetical protein BJ742DRAFT_895189, partial [Cladochytrium replicatum]